MWTQSSKLFGLFLLVSVLTFIDARIDGPREVKKPTHEYEEQIKAVTSTVTLEIDARLQPIWERLQNAEQNQLPQIVTDFRDVISEMLAVMEYVVEHELVNASNEYEGAQGSVEDDFME